MLVEVNLKFPRGFFYMDPVMIILVNKEFFDKATSLIRNSQTIGSDPLRRLSIDVDKLKRKVILARIKYAE